MILKYQFILVLVTVVCVFIQVAAHKNRRPIESSKSSKRIEGNDKRQDKSREHSLSGQPSSENTPLVRQKRIKREESVKHPGTVVTVENSKPKSTKNIAEAQKGRLKNFSKSKVEVMQPGDQASSAADNERRLRQLKEAHDKSHKDIVEHLQKTAARNSIRQPGKNKQLSITREHEHGGGRGRARNSGLAHLKQEHERYDQVIDRALKQANRKKEHSKISKKKKHRNGDAFEQAKKLGGGRMGAMKHFDENGKLRSSPHSGLSTVKHQPEVYYIHQQGGRKNKKSTRSVKDRKSMHHNKEMILMQKKEKDLVRQITELQKLRGDNSALSRSHKHKK